MNTVQRWLPWIAATLACIYVGMRLVQLDLSDSTYHLQKLRAVPTSGEGRTKPLDTVARNSLMVLSGKQSLRTDGRKVSAIEWYIELITKPNEAVNRRVVRIDHPDVLALLGLNTEKRTRFSFDELRPKLNEISRQAQLADQTKAKARDPFQRAILTLYQRLLRFSELSQLQRPYAVAPLTSSDQWRSLYAVLKENRNDPDAQMILKVFEDYSQDNPAAFNADLDAYLEKINQVLPAEARKARSEVVFNRVQPFYVAAVIYVVAFLVGCFGLLLSQIKDSTWGDTLRRTMLSLIAVAFVVQTIGIIARIYLQGRPPVTNLYSSAVFIGWISVMLGVFVDRQMKLGLAGILAAAIGFGSLVIAHNLGASGDTMEMMQAVLDSNFWLSTHVVVVTIGYSATFFAGFLAIAYILLGVFTKMIDKERAKSLSKMIYGVICFAALMSFVGTVLGGIWADQSWGRFWGWDPKENGAALIVLMNLLILHARWGGMIRDRGVAVLAVAGNIVTVWSWFGTNMLGVGLHSYGFTQSAMFWLGLFILSQLIIIAIGLIPTHLWRSQAGMAKLTASRAHSSVG